MPFFNVHAVREDEPHRVHLPDGVSLRDDHPPRGEYSPEDAEQGGDVERRGGPPKETLLYHKVMADTPEGAVSEAMRIVTLHMRAKNADPEWVNRFQAARAAEMFAVYLTDVEGGDIPGIEWAVTQGPDGFTSWDSVDIIEAARSNDDELAELVSDINRKSELPDENKPEVPGDDGDDDPELETDGGTSSERDRSERAIQWEQMAHTNVQKWGNQPVDSLLLAMGEEMGELAGEVYRMADHGDADRTAERGRDLIRRMDELGQDIREFLEWVSEDRDGDPIPLDERPTYLNPYPPDLDTALRKRHIGSELDDLMALGYQLLWRLETGDRPDPELETDGGLNWTEQYATTTYRGPQKYPVPGAWTLGIVEADGIGWKHYPDAGEDRSHETDVMDTMDADEYREGPDARAALMSEYPDGADVMTDPPYHELKINGDVVMVLKDASEVDESEWWAAIAEALARYDSGGEYETVLSDLGLDHLKADPFSAREDPEDTNRSLDDFSTGEGGDA